MSGKPGVIFKFTVSSKEGPLLVELLSDDTYRVSKAKSVSKGVGDPDPGADLFSRASGNFNRRESVPASDGTISSPGPTLPWKHYGSALNADGSKPHRHVRDIGPTKKI